MTVGDRGVEPRVKRREGGGHPVIANKRKV